MLGRLSGEECFHTTQYDLNLLISFQFKTHSKKFPYYIVRFKLSKKRNRKKRQHKFPYYIVRFKPCVLFLVCVLSISFHTTQYDLNGDVLFWISQEERGFHTTQYDLNHDSIQNYVLFVVSFHTTQYDLNCKYQSHDGYSFFVSILHSTI